MAADLLMHGAHEGMPQLPPRFLIGYVVSALLSLGGLPLNPKVQSAIEDRSEVCWRLQA